MGIPPRTDSVRQDETVEPVMNDTVTGPECNAPPFRDESGKSPVHRHVSRFRVGRRVAEGLHEQRSLEAETGQLLQLVGSHRSGGVLGTDRGHAWFAGRSRQHPGQAAGPAHHLLRQRVFLVRQRFRVPCSGEQPGFPQPQSATGPVRECPADYQRNPATGPVFVCQGYRLQREG